MYLSHDSVRVTLAVTFRDAHGGARARFEYWLDMPHDANALDAPQGSVRFFDRHRPETDREQLQLHANDALPLCADLDLVVDDHEPVPWLSVGHNGPPQLLKKRGKMHTLVYDGARFDFFGGRLETMTLTEDARSSIWPPLEPFLREALIALRRRGTKGVSD